MSVVGIHLELLQELSKANLWDIETQRMTAGKGWDVRSTCWIKVADLLVNGVQTVMIIGVVADDVDDSGYEIGDCFVDALRWTV